MVYLLNNLSRVGTLLGEHLRMTSLSLAIAILVAVPIALLITRWRWLNLPVLGTLNMLYTMPSLALMILLVPLLGLNERSVIVAMVIYAQVILVRSLEAGLRSIAPEILEAARGMGMNGWQQWWRVQVPLMAPIFLAGVRIAAIAVVAIATIGAKFGAGGLGTLLFEGIAQSGRTDKLWAGAIAVSALAFGLNGALLVLERWVARGTTGEFSVRVQTLRLRSPFE